MTNNDILRRLRYTFQLNDTEMIAMFAGTEVEIRRSEISNWLKKDEDPDYMPLSDYHLAYFLNSFIEKNRGKKEGAEAPKVERQLTNNIILRKLKIALNLRDEDIIEILKLVDFELSVHELSALFRNPDHRKYKPCQNQLLRNFIHGLQLNYRKEEA